MSRDTTPQPLSVNPPRLVSLDAAEARRMRPPRMARLFPLTFSLGRLGRMHAPTSPAFPDLQEVLT